VLMPIVWACGFPASKISFCPKAAWGRSTQGLEERLQMNIARNTLLVAASGLAMSVAAAQAETLTISWWGFNGEKLDQYIVQPFQEQCGCELVFETGNNADRLNKVNIRGGAGVDVIYLTDS